MIRRVVRSVGAGLILAATVVAVPWLLARYGSVAVDHWPALSEVRALPSATLSDDAVFVVLTLAAWIAWLVFTVSVGVEVVAVARGIDTPRLPAAGLLQRAATRLVAAAFLSMTMSRPLPTFAAIPTSSRPAVSARLPAPSMMASERAPTSTTAVAATASGAGQGEEASGGDGATAEVDAPSVVTVQPGDSAWQIAEDYLHDGMRWRDLWDLNADRPQPDGSSWTDPQLLLPGWQLQLPPHPTPSTTTGAPSVAASEGGWYTVVEGDTLSGIAAREFADPAVADQLFALNRDRPQPDGGRLEDPNLILPGWQLALPAQPEAAPASTVPSASNDTGDATHFPAPPPSPTTVMPSTASAPAGARDVPTTRKVKPSSEPSAVTAARYDEPPSRSQDLGTTRTGDAGTLGSPVELGGVAGATVLATGLWLLLLRLRRRRRIRGNHGSPTSVGTSTATSTTRGVVGAADVPLVRWAAHTLNSLGDAPLTDGQDGDAKPVMVELSAADGLEVLWDAPRPHPPPGWIVSDDGWTWRHGYEPDDAFPEGDPPPPLLPGLVTVGERRDGHQLLVDLEAFGAIAVTGDRARVESFLRAIIVELSTGEVLTNVELATLDVDEFRLPVVADRVVAVDGAQAVELLTTAVTSVEAALFASGVSSSFAYRRSLHASALPLESQVVIARCDDPALGRALVDVTPAHRGVALLLAGAAAEVSGASNRLVLDADGTCRLEPLGLACNAVGLSNTTSAALVELISAEEETVTDGPVTDTLLFPTLGVGRLQPSSDDAPPTDPDLLGVTALGRDDAGDPGAPLDASERGGRLDRVMDGVVLVRVLGAPVVADRPALSRRETQLTVFLACKERPATTASVQDALWNGQAVAAKTVWNLVSRTRAKLGSTSDGRALMPATDRVTNSLRLVDEVRTDLSLLREYYAQALDLSTDDAIAALTAGLGLVEGPPFDAPGYDWAHHGDQWVAEASTLIERAALLLVELASDAGDLAAARAAVMQGLRGLPGNEPLYRARMCLEHQAGNLAGVRSAYDELVALLDDLEMEPSTTTDALYHQLLTAGART